MNNKIMRYILTLLFSTFFSILSFGQSTSLLWEISGNGLEKPSYVFGTMHVKDKRVFCFGDSLFPKLESCEAFAGEILIDGNFNKDAVEQVIMPVGVTLKTLLPKSDYKVVRKYARKNLGVYSLLINKIKPIFVSALITEMSMKKDMNKNLDEYLQDQARKRGKFIIGLEEVEEQLDVLNKFSLEEQAEMLLTQIKEIDEQNKMTEEMIRLYTNQDLAALMNFVNDSPMSDEFSYSLIEERNYKMTDKILTIMPEKSVFVAVGVAHLPGEEGILELLRKSGYSVTPVDNKPRYVKK